MVTQLAVRRAEAAAMLAARCGASNVAGAARAAKAGLDGLDLNKLTPAEGAMLARVSYAAWKREGGDGTARGWCWIWLSYVNNLIGEIVA